MGKHDRTFVSRIRIEIEALSELVRESPRLGIAVALVIVFGAIGYALYLSGNLSAGAARVGQPEFEKTTLTLVETSAEVAAPTAVSSSPVPSRIDPRIGWDMNKDGRPHPPPRPIPGDR